MDAGLSSEVLERALQADRASVRALIAYILPVVRARVLRALHRRGSAQGRGRDPGQELDDLTQEVLSALFANDARVLRTWDPERGASLLNFVGLVAERQVAAVFRTGKRSPWTEDPTLSEELDEVANVAPPPESAVASRELLEVMLERLRATLSPLGMSLFQRLIVDERPVADVSSELKMTMDAVYAWRSRLGRLVRKLAVELENESALSKSVPTPQRPMGDGAS